MAQLVMAETAEGEGPGVARDRIYKRSQRLREALLQTAARLHNDACFDAVGYNRIVRAITQVLLRCQRPTPPIRLPP
jgi:hypothetical protein